MALAGPFILVPDMILGLGALAYARTIVPPQPTSLGLLPRHLEPLLSPYPLHLLVIHTPSLPVQQGRDPAVAITTIGFRQLDNPRHQPGLTLTEWNPVPLCRSRLSQDTTGPTLRDSEYATYVTHCTASPGRAQKFPELASLRMALSNA